MQRNLAALQEREFDLVIVGGGVFGLSVAWDASLRGLSVALLEQRDFAHAASSQCFKMIHGGIRYLQHVDLVRVRHSARERSALLRIAPHLARPLPIFVPTYGHGMKGREVLTAGMLLYDLLTADRNRNIRDASRRIPRTRSVSRARALEMFPELPRDGLSGGAIFHDGQMYSTSRLALAFLLSAAEQGAAAANYVQVSQLLTDGDRIVGVHARDLLGSDEFEVRGRMVLNAAGGWAPHLRTQSGDPVLKSPPTFSRDAYFLVKRPFPSKCALAVTGQSRDPDALFSRDARHLFLVPWRDCTLVGVWHVVYDRDPSEACVREDEVARWMDEIRSAYPAADFKLDDVALTQCGLVLFGENESGATDLRYGKRSMLIDHARFDGRDGLVTLIGVRFTTARADAARATELIFRKLGRTPPACRTEIEPLHGGDLESFEGECNRAARAAGDRVPTGSLEALVSNHGSAWSSVLEWADSRSELLRPLAGSCTLGAEVVHAARHEMAVRLSDVVFRRSDLGSAGHPGEEALTEAADLMAGELHWSAARRQQEINDTSREFSLLIGSGKPA